MNSVENVDIIMEGLRAGQRLAEGIPVSKSIKAVQEFMHSYKNRGIRKVIGDEEVFIDFGSNISPSVIRPITGVIDDYTYMILPIRIKD